MANAAAGGLMWAEARRWPGMCAPVLSAGALGVLRVAI
jgi:hypothetical protein